MSREHKTVGYIDTKAGEKPAAMRVSLQSKLVVGSILCILLLVIGDGYIRGDRTPEPFPSSMAEASLTEAVSVTESVKAAEAAAVVSTSPPEQVMLPTDLNTVTAEQLMLIDGIGESTAAAIIAYRTKVGVLTSVEQLIEVKGVGAETVERLKEFLFVSDEVYVPYESSVTTTAETSAKKTAAETAGRETSEKTRRTRAETEPPEQQPAETEPTETEETTVLPPEISVQTEPPEPRRVPVDINHADAEEIAQCLLLPIEKAEDIIAVREQISYFSNVAELNLVESLTKQEIMDITEYIIITPL